MKKLIYNVVVFIALPFICARQITFSGIIHTVKSNGGDFMDKDLFHTKEILSEYTNRTPLQLQQDAVQQRPEALTLTLPFKNKASAIWRTSSVFE